MSHQKEVSYKDMGEGGAVHPHHGNRHGVGQPLPREGGVGEQFEHHQVWLGKWDCLLVCIGLRVEYEAQHSGE